MRIRLKLNVSSVSDIITNSSSEVFMRITGHEEEIYDLLSGLFSGDDPELSPCVRLCTREERAEWNDDYESFPPEWVEIELPYGFQCQEFMEVGIRAILNEAFGEGSYVAEVVW